MSDMTERLAALTATAERLEVRQMLADAQREIAAARKPQRDRQALVDAAHAAQATVTAEKRHAERRRLSEMPSADVAAAVLAAGRNA